MTDPVRARLAELMAARGASARSLSLMLGRNGNYLEHFIRRGSPKLLHEDDRLTLAKIFRINERELGARDPWAPD